MNFSAPHRQSGFATVLIMVLVGITMSVALLSGVDMIRGTQSQTTTYHSQVQAQMNAWSGVSAMHEYIQGLQQSETPPSAEDLFESFEMAHEEESNIFRGSSGLEAYVTKLEGDNGQFDLTVSIHGVSMPRADRVKAVSIIDVVSRFTKGEATLPPKDPSPTAFYIGGDLTLGGSIEIISDTDTPYEISVDGLVKTGDNSIRGMDVIKATESIDLGSDSEFKVLRTNGDVRLTGGVTVLEEIQAQGNVCMTGGTGSPGLTKANGFVYGNGGATFGDIQAKGETIKESYHRLCESKREVDGKGNLIAVNLAGDHSLRNVQSLGTVRNHGGSISSLLADGDLLNGYGSVDSGTITGEAFYCSSGVKNCKPLPIWKKDDIKVATDPNLSVAISDAKPVDEPDVPDFDANEFREFSNYAFSINEDGFPVVTVKHVQSIPDDQYFLGSYDDPYKDRLCTTLTASSSPSNPKCATPSAENSHPICKGGSSDNRCFSYDAGSSEWKIKGESMAQGIAWFDGNLLVGGTYFNTFIATQNIQTAGSTRLYAPNYVGYAGYNDSPHGICQNTVLPNIPTQLCDDDTYNSDWAQGIGNYAAMAGSVLDNGGYLGGNIMLVKDTVAYGSVLAGNEINTGGSTTVYGYISAYAGGEVTGNAMEGSTTMMLKGLPPSYTPQGPIEKPEIGEGSEEAFGFELLWTRPG